MESTRDRLPIQLLLFATTQVSTGCAVYSWLKHESLDLSISAFLTAIFTEIAIDREFLITETPWALVSPIVTSSFGMYFLATAPESTQGIPITLIPDPPSRRYKIGSVLICSAMMGTPPAGYVELFTAGITIGGAAVLGKTHQYKPFAFGAASTAAILAINYFAFKQIPPVVPTLAAVAATIASFALGRFRRNYATQPAEPLPRV